MRLGSHALPDMRQTERFYYSVIGALCGDCHCNHRLFGDWLCAECRQDQDDFWAAEMEHDWGGILWERPIPEREPPIEVEVYDLQVTYVDGFLYVRSNRFPKLGIETVEDLKRQIKKLRVA